MTKIMPWWNQEQHTRPYHGWMEPLMILCK
jgi:hypothetical protein